MTKRIAPADDMADGIDLTRPVPMTQDGSPVLPPARSPLPPRPSLCTAGPCAHYHRLEIQVDAESPRGRRLPVVVAAGTPGIQTAGGGQTYTPPAAWHTQVSHYCYPDTGVEMTLGSTPVVACNRWRPEDWLEWRPGDVRQAAMSIGHASHTSCESYLRDVEDWERLRKQELEDDDEAERLIRESMARFNQQEETK